MPQQIVLDHFQPPPACGRGGTTQWWVRARRRRAPLQRLLPLYFGIIQAVAIPYFSGTGIAEAFQHFDILLCKVALRLEPTIGLVEPGIQIFLIGTQIRDTDTIRRHLLCF